jgi:hypothetical protein
MTVSNSQSANLDCSGLREKGHLIPGVIFLAEDEGHFSGLLPTLGYAHGWILNYVGQKSACGKSLAACHLRRGSSMACGK